MKILMNKRIISLSPVSKTSSLLAYTHLLTSVNTSGLVLWVHAPESFWVYEDPRFDRDPKSLLVCVWVSLRSSLSIKDLLVYDDRFYHTQ